MKKFNLLYVVLGTVTVIIVIIGCVISSTTSFAQKNENVMDTAAINDALESEEVLVTEEESMEQKAEIIFNEWGYTYSKTGNNDSCINIGDSNDIVNSKQGQEGKEEYRPDVILQWSDAQKTLTQDELCWLNNEYLYSYADDISFIISDSDIVTAKYSMQTSEVKVSLFTVAEDDSEYFEFNRNYTSEIYNIHQIQENHTWYCFSYRDYEDIEYTSAVFANENTVCEIIFENCDNQFIADTLVAY